MNPRRLPKPEFAQNPKKGEQLLGGHAVVAVGYQDGLFGGKTAYQLKGCHICN
jgi:hypothetical protein